MIQCDVTDPGRGGSVASGRGGRREARRGWLVSELQRRPRPASDIAEGHSRTACVSWSTTALH